MDVNDWGHLLPRLARVQFTVGYVAVLLGISCAILMLGPHAHDVLRSARQYQPAQPGPRPHRNDIGQRAGRRRRSALLWLPFLTCLLHTRRAAFAHLPAARGVPRRPYRRDAAGRRCSGRGGRIRLDAVVDHPGERHGDHGALAALGAMTAVIPPRWRAAWVGWWVSAGVAAAISGGDFHGRGSYRRRGPWRAGVLAFPSAGPPQNAKPLDRSENDS